MKFKTSTRLRLEYLEKRNLLSAMGLPFLSRAISLPQPPSSDYFQVSENQAVHATLQDASLNGAGNSASIPNQTPMQLAPDLNQLSFTQPTVDGRFGNATPTLVGVPDFIPNLTPTQLAPVTNLPYAQPPINGRLGDAAPNSIGISDSIPNLTPMQIAPDLNSLPYTQPTAVGRLGDVGLAPAHDFHSSPDASNQTSSADSVISAASEAIVLDNMVSVHTLPDAGLVVVSVTSPPPAARLSDAARVVSVDALFTFDLMPPRRDWQPPRDADDPQDDSTNLNADPPPDLQSSTDSPDGPAAFVNMVVMQVPMIPTLDLGIEGVSANRPTAVIRPPVSHAADPADSVVLETDVPPVDSYSPLPPARQHSTDTIVTLDTIRPGDAVAMTVGMALPSVSGDLNSSTSLTNIVDSSTWNAPDGGFITVNDFPATASGATNKNNTGFTGMNGAGIDHNNGLAGILQTPQTLSDADGARKSAPSGGNLAADASSRSVPKELPPFADSKEGGGIELVIADLSSAVGDDSRATEGQSVENAARQVSDIRPESDVGLFCDIEVASAPTGSLGGQKSSGILDHTAASMHGGASLRERKSIPDKELGRPGTIWLQPTLAELGGQLPMILGVTFWISQGGLRLEEKVAERERNLPSVRVRPK